MKTQLKQTLIMLALLASIQLANAQPTVIALNYFNGGNGFLPYGGLVQASDGNFYGTTSEGGVDNDGVFFHITTNGALTRLYSFTNGNDGDLPKASLVQASDGNLYGTAEEGGTNGLGTVFRVTTSGVLTPLYSFTGGGDGSLPLAGLVQASDGNLYGTTYSGGTNSDGAVFRITTSGTFTPLYSFSGVHDGAFPEDALVQASDGNLYGTTYYGGTNNAGAVFRITTNGALTPLYSFTGSNDGANPVGGLVQASDGNLYGTAYEGGISNGASGDGTVFRITTNGSFTLLYTFTNGNDGTRPYAGLVQANDANLYGTTSRGGTNSDGTIFRITTTGAFRSLHSFTGVDGQEPYSGMVKASNGNLFGTTVDGGNDGEGAVFELTLPSPHLNISPGGNQSVLFWPTWTPNNYVLQSTTNLASPNWITVSNAVVTIAVTNTVTVTNSVPAQFFRLAPQ